MPTMGEILAELREDKKLKQKDLAALLCVARNTISGYENDNFTPDLQNIIKLAEIFDVSVDYLLGLVRSNVNIRQIDEEYCKCDNQVMLSGDVFKRILKLNHNTRNMLIDYITFLEEKGKK